MSKTRIVNAAAPIAILCAALVATGASAQQRVVIDRDALARPGGTEALYEAIEEAAEAVCRRANAHVSVFGPSVRRRAIETCVSDTIEATVQAIDAPRLDALHARAGAGAVRLASRQGR